MYYLKNRYYDPEIRRFISADNFKSEKASMETLHNRNLFAYCDDNPLVRADQDGNAWMVAAASFVAGMGLSVGCQMIFEGKNLSEINWITAASAGLGTAMGFLGIGGSTTGAVVSGVTSFASDYYENRDLRYDNLFSYIPNILFSPAPYSLKDLKLMIFPHLPHHL